MLKFAVTLFFLIFSSNLWAQQFSIKGNIKDDESNKSLGYANVRVLGTTIGTAANLQGSYELILNAGKYTLVVSYIGYYSDTAYVYLGSDITDLNFRLKKSEITLPEVVVLPGENPALEIIRKAIQRKNIRNSNLNSYEFDAYTKGIVRTEDELLTRGRSVSTGISNNDTSGLMITGILENQSKGFYKKPDNFKEIIIAQKQSANFPSSLNILTGGRIIQNFYENEVSFFGRDIPGPIQDNALDYYQYYIENTSIRDDEKIYKINMYPKDPQDPGFEGSIFITDSTYNLIKVDLQINKAANTGGILDSINIVQQFSNLMNFICRLIIISW